MRMESQEKGFHAGDHDPVVLTRMHHEWWSRYDESI